MFWIFSAAALLSVAVIVAAIIIGAQRQNAEIQATIRSSIQSGGALSPEMIAAISAARPRNDFRRGAILLATAAAFLVAGALMGIGERDPLEEFAIMAGVAAFPGLIGLTLIGLHLGERRDRG
jgi:hypothetical protein